MAEAPTEGIQTGTDFRPVMEAGAPKGEAWAAQAKAESDLTSASKDRISARMEAAQAKAKLEAGKPSEIVAKLGNFAVDCLVGFVDTNVKAVNVLASERKNVAKWHAENLINIQTRTADRESKARKQDMGDKRLADLGLTAGRENIFKRAWEGTVTGVNAVLEKYHEARIDANVKVATWREGSAQKMQSFADKFRRAASTTEQDMENIDSSRKTAFTQESADAQANLNTANTAVDQAKGTYDTAMGPVNKMAEGASAQIASEQNPDTREQMHDTNFDAMNNALNN